MLVATTVGLNLMEVLIGTGCLIASCVTEEYTDDDLFNVLAGDGCCTGAGLKKNKLKF